MNEQHKKIIGGVALSLVILIVLVAVISAVIDSWRGAGPSEFSEPPERPVPAIAEP